MNKVKMNLAILCLSFVVAAVGYADCFLQLPSVKQSNDYSCGAAAAQSILAYFGEETFEIELSTEMNTNSFYGTACEDLICLFKMRGYVVEGGEHMTLQSVKNFLSQGKPVICLIQIVVEGIQYGHYVVALGYDHKNLYFMNPTNLGYYGFIPFNEFESRWHHQFEHQNFSYEHWGLAVYKDSPLFDFNQIRYIP